MRERDSERERGIHLIIEPVVVVVVVVVNIAC